MHWYTVLLGWTWHHSYKPIITPHNRTLEIYMHSALRCCAPPCTLWYRACIPASVLNEVLKLMWTMLQCTLCICEGTGNCTLFLHCTSMHEDLNVWPLCLLSDWKPCIRVLYLGLRPTLTVRLLAQHVHTVLVSIYCTGCLFKKRSVAANLSNFYHSAVLASWNFEFDCAWEYTQTAPWISPDKVQ